MNAYEYVENLLREGKYYISEFVLKSYEEWEVALAILKTKYNAKYSEPYDCRECGNYTFDNPYLKKVPALKLQYCYFDEDEWKTLGEFIHADFIGREIKMLDFDKNRMTNKDIFNEIIKNKVFVGKARLWRIKETEMYE